MEDEILKILENQKKAIKPIEVFNIMELEDAVQLKEVQDTLSTLCKKGIVHGSKKGKYILVNKCSTLYTGILDINSKRHGYVKLKDREDLHIYPEDLNGAVDGDFVEANEKDDGNGVILRIINRELKPYIATIIKGKKGFDIEPKNKKLNFKILLDQKSTKNCVEGSVVLLKLTPVEDKQNVYSAEVASIIGHKDDPKIDIIEEAANFEIDNFFSEEALRQANNLPTSVSEQEMKGRIDCRENIIFTIDGKDTKDIDDAIELNVINNQYELTVHIADVSHYVTEKSPLFLSAYEKGTSSYLADTVFPMLPHILSNGICSLNENEDRLAMSVKMKIDHNGNIFDSEIFESVIKSKKKMNYDDVNQILMKNAIPKGYENFADNLHQMHDLSKILRRKMIADGYIDFDTDEAKVVQDENGIACDIIKREQLEGEKLIENFMIAANITVAKTIQYMDLPFIYRVHGEPRTEKIEDFIQLLKVLGIRLDTNMNEFSPLNIQNIVNEIASKAPTKTKILNKMLLRTMQKAIYSANNIGHFGLGYTNLAKGDAYTHYTSPIRRFPDLMVHTLLKKYLFQHDYSAVGYYEENLPKWCEHISKKEQDSVNAEREVNDMKFAEYMESKIGEEYEGMISTITNFGMYIELPNTVEGLVHISTLGKNYHYNSDYLCMQCNDDIVYKLGDIVKVVVVGASKEMHTVDFEIANN